MGFFQKIGHAFSSAGRSVGGLFSKGAHEVGSAFRKGGHVIARGLGGMAGGSLGAEMGGGLALALGQPELAPAFAGAGALIGRTVGAEGAGRIETTTRGIASGKRPILGGQMRRSDSPPKMVMPPVQPPKLPSPAPRKAMVGRNGGGIYRPPVDGNLLEKTKPKPKRNFV